MPLAFSSNLHDSAVDCTRNAIPFSVHPRSDISAFLPQFFSQLWFDEGHPASIPLCFVSWNLLSAIGALN
jgi:hypothetical protein